MAYQEARKCGRIQEILTMRKRLNIKPETEEKEIKRILKLIRTGSDSKRTERKRWNSYGHPCSRMKYFTKDLDELGVVDKMDGEIHYLEWNEDSEESST